MDILKRNNVTITGHGEIPLIFAHGFIGDQTLWRHVVPHFRDDFKIILFDYVGSGRSEKSAYSQQRYSRLEGYARDVVEICQALKLTNPIFVGHSISCMIALIAAVQGICFSSVIMVTPSPRYINDFNYHGGFDKTEIQSIIDKIDRDYANWAKELAPRVINKTAAPDLVNELVNALLTTDHKVAMNFARATFFSDYRRELLKFKTPTLVLQCQQDIMAPIDVGDYIHAHLHNCTLKRLKAKGHFPQLSSPKEVADSIREFLKVQKETIVTD